jgi:hypothetical protein
VAAGSPAAGVAGPRHPAARRSAIIMITGIYPGNKPDSFCMKIPEIIFNGNFLKSFGMHLPG